MHILFFFVLGIILARDLTPLSECEQLKITKYPYKGGGSCMFGTPTMYGGFASTGLYNNGTQCGICYELVGPDNVLYFMVDNICPKCDNNMNHIELHEGGFNSIIENKDIGMLNVTFRMVACIHEGNMILKTYNYTSQYYYAFTVMNHVIGLKKVYYSFDNEIWHGIDRELEYNCWAIKEQVKLPFYLQFESIAGEKVQTIINQIKPSFSFDTGVQFSVPNDTYFDIKTLEEKPSVKIEECCKKDDSFTNIYDEGQILGSWGDYSTCERDLKYTEDCFPGSNECIKIALENYNYFVLWNLIYPETQRYEGVEFLLKSESRCVNCLTIKSEDSEKILLSTTSPGIWEKKIVKLSELGIKTKKFKDFVFYANNKEKQIFYFDKIKLIKSDYVDNGTCWVYHKNSNYYLTRSWLLNILLLVCFYL